MYNAKPGRPSRPSHSLRRSIRQPAAAPSLRRKPPKPPLQGEVPPQAAEGCRTAPHQYPPGSPHTLPHRQTSRQTAAYPSLPVPGHNVGRAFTPAAAPLRHHTANRQSPPAQQHPSTSRPPLPPAANLQSLPCKGRCRRRRRRGAAPRPANTLPCRGTPPVTPLAAHAPPPLTCEGPDALHRLAAKPRGKLPLTRRCPFPATM